MSSDVLRHVRSMLLSAVALGYGAALGLGMLFVMRSPIDAKPQAVVWIGAWSLFPLLSLLRFVDATKDSRSRPLPDAGIGGHGSDSGRLLRLLTYASICSLVWSVFLLAFWPGVMSPDSYAIWHMARVGNYGSWHPPFHTFIYSLIMKVWAHPAAVVFAQIALLSLVSSYTVERFRAAGLPARACLAIMAAMAVYPVNGRLAVTLWKDVWFAIAMVSVTGSLFSVWRARVRGLEPAGNAVWLAIGLTLCSALRHNGVFVTVGTSLIALFIFKRSRFLFISLLVLLHLLLTGFNSFCLNARPTPRYMVYSVMYEDVLAVLRNGDRVNERDADGLFGAGAVAAFRPDPYEFTQGRSLVEQRGGSLADPQVRLAITKKWAQTVARHPIAVVGWRLHTARWLFPSAGARPASLLFCLQPHPSGGYGSCSMDWDIPDRDVGIRAKPVQLSVCMYSFLKRIEESGLWVVLSHPGIPILALLLSTAFAALRCGPAVFAVAVPSISLLLGFAVLPMNRELRYAYALCAVGLLFSPCLTYAAFRMSAESPDNATPCRPAAATGNEG